METTLRTTGDNRGEWGITVERCRYFRQAHVHAYKRSTEHTDVQHNLHNNMSVLFFVS